MSTLLPSAFKTITAEEIRRTVTQSARAEMTSIHINQALFIFIELSATHRV